MNSLPNDMDITQVENWRRAIRETTFANYHHAMGQALLKTGEIDAAIRSLYKSIESCHTYFEAYVALIDALEVKGDLAGSERVRQAGIKLNPDFFAIGLARQAEWYFDASAFEPAIAVWSRLARDCPSYASVVADGYSRVSICLWRRNEHEGVLNHTAQAIALDPLCADAWYFRALSLRGLDRFEQARRIISNFIALDPQHCDGMVNLGFILAILLEFEKADTVLRLAGRLQPESVVMQATRCLVLLAAGRPVEAYTILSSRLARLECEPVIKSYAALCLAEMGDITHAELLSQEASTADPTLATYQGLIVHKAGNPDTAEALHRETLKWQPLSSFALGNLGLALLDKGKSEDAKSAFEASAKAGGRMIPFEARQRHWAFEEMVQGYAMAGVQV